jgi:hypothetical protein
MGNAPTAAPRNILVAKGFLLIHGLAPRGENLRLAGRKPQFDSLAGPPEREKEETMVQFCGAQPTLGTNAIVASLETVSVETRREVPQPGCPSLENHGGKRDASGSPSARQKNGWSYYVFCQEVRTLLERGRERAVRVGGTSFLL